jgi:CRISPR/Cas system type I-B associated protein Csh2 (Cas7 group RAMP superfamily)
MLKTSAIHDAHQALGSASLQIKGAIDQLGSIRRAAVTDGWVRHIKTQVTKLEAVLKEVKDMTDCIDFEIDDLKTIADNGD